MTPSSRTSALRLLVVDLDNTLYHADSGLFAQMDDNINRFIRDRLGLSWEEADAMRLRYWRQYGTTLGGLMQHHGIEPEAFLHAAHNLEIDQSLNAAPQLEAELGRLPMRKVIHTNGTREHAERVLLRLGIRHHFSTIYDIRFRHYQPKPCGETLKFLLDQEACPPRQALVIDDVADNLRAAQSIGCATAWITRSPQPDTAFDHHAPSIEALLHRLVAQELAITRDPAEKGVIP